MFGSSRDTLRGPQFRSMLGRIQNAVRGGDNLALMVNPITILTAQKEDPDGLILTFSDGTTAAYLVDELLELRPHREPTEYMQEITDVRPHLSLVKGFNPN